MLFLDCDIATVARNTEKRKMASSNTMDSDPNTLTRFILAEQKKHADAKGDLTIVRSLSLFCRETKSLVILKKNKLVRD